MPKYTVRKMIRALKPTGLKFLDRKKVAKAQVAGTSVTDVLQELGFLITDAVPCCEERCDPWAHATWKKGDKILRTNFGVLFIPKPQPPVTPIE